MQEPQPGAAYGQYIRRIAFHIMRVQDDLFAPYEITSQQARALGAIRICRKENGGCCQKDLENAFGLRGSSITSLLKGLEKHGYVRRESGLRDGRTKQLSLTAKGEELIDTFIGIFAETERRIVNGMTEEERRLLLELLRRAAENLD